MPKIVTAAALLITSSALGCHGRPQDRNVAVTEGTAKITEMNRTEGELGNRFAIELKPRFIDQSERGIGVESNGRDYKWQLVDRARRTEAKNLLEKFVRQSNEVLLIGLADKKVVLTDREQIVARRDAAQSFLDNLEAKQPTFDPNYEPKGNAKPADLYEHSVGI